MKAVIPVVLLLVCFFAIHIDSSMGLSCVFCARSNKLCGPNDYGTIPVSVCPADATKCMTNTTHRDCIKPSEIPGCQPPNCKTCDGYACNKD